MAIHIFRSGKQPDMFGFTTDDTGSNLPPELGPWSRSVADSAVGGDSPLDQAAGSDAMSAALKRDGFYVVSSEKISQQAGVPWVD